MAIKGQTVIQYGSPGSTILQITGVHTIRMDQESVWDEHSGHNQIATKFTVTARGLVHNFTDVSQPHADPTGGGDATDIMRHIRFLAMRTRERFVMLVGCDADGGGGTVLLECDPAPNNNSQAPRLNHIDIANGPKCISCNVEKVQASLYHVDFTYEIFRSPSCQDDGENRSNNTGILSVSFSMTEEISDIWITSRIWEGQIRSATSRINPHSFRLFALPKLQLGMRRDRMTFTSSPDSLLLNFTIRDVETHVAPPPPALKWSPGFSKTFVSGTGSKTYFELSCGLEGSRFADRRLLLRICSTIIDRHLFVNEGRQIDGSTITTILEHLLIRENITNDSATVFVSVRASRSVFGQNLNTIIDTTLGQDPADFIKSEQGFAANNRRPLPPELVNWDTREHRGNWEFNFDGPNGDRRGITLEASGYVDISTALSTHLQSECSKDRSVQDGVKAVKFPARASGETVSIQKYTAPLTELPPRARRVTNDHKAAPYTTWIMESKIEINQHVVPMPVAQFSDSSLSTATLPSVLHIALAPPQAMMIVRAYGVRVGARPEMPLPYSFTDERTGIVYQLLDSKDIPSTPDQRPGGDVEWTQNIQITYSMSRAPLPGESLLIGKTPWDLLGIQRTVPGSTGFFEGTPLT